MLKKSILLIIMLLIICNVWSQSYIYGDTIYYSNGSQYTNISILLVDLNNVRYINPVVEYNGITYKIPQNANNYSINIPPIKTNISITITGRKQFINKWIIDYTIKNNYNKDIFVNISFPEGYNINNVSNLLIPSKSSKTITLIKYDYSNNIYFEDSNISCNLPEKISIIYMESIPFSIEKSNKIQNNTIIWNGTYIIDNTKNKTLNIKGSFWVKINNTDILLDNFSNIILHPFQKYVKSHNIVSNLVPIFYIKFNNTNKFYENISLKPALEYNGSYIIGISKVKGIRLIDNTNWNNNNNNNNQNNNQNNNNQNNNNNNNQNNNNQNNNNNNQDKDDDNQNNNNQYENIIEDVKKYIVLKDKNIVINGITIKKPENSTTTALVGSLIITFAMFLMFIIPLLKPTIISNVKLSPELIKLLKIKNYMLYDNNNKDILNLLNVNNVVPNNSELAIEICEILDIPLEQAHTIVFALENSATIITEDINLYKLATLIGLTSKLIK